MTDQLRLGTRGSALALAQARMVADALGGAELVAIKTSGDREREHGERAVAAGAGGDKARFVREIEQALLDGEVDVAVHSAKDVPSDTPAGLEIVGVPAREEPLDAFVGDATTLDEVPEGARIGTSSLRRRAQLLAARPDLDVVAMRGNVDTRLKRLAEGDYDGIVLAAAGLRRLGREREIAFALGSAQMVPAAGQGSLAIQARRGDGHVAEAAAALTDRTALAEFTAERSVVSALDATCLTPVGVLARAVDGELRIEAFVGMPDGSEWLRDSIDGDPTAPSAAGTVLAQRLLSAGAAELLERAHKQAGSLQ